ILNSSLVEVFPNLNCQKYLLRLNQVFKGGPPVIFSSQLHQFIIPCKLYDGQYRIQHTTVRAVRIKDEKSFHALFVIEDVTDLTNKLLERQRAEKQLIESEKKMRKQKEELLDFASFISHDLRNSFHGIEGYLELLQMGHDQDKDQNQCQEYMELMQKQIKSMKNLLERSLKLAEAGVAIEKRLKVDLFQIVKETAELTVPEKVQFVNGLRYTVFSDPEKLSQVFKNLLENAVIHGNPGMIEAKGQQVENGIEVLIINDGKEIPSENTAYLFERGFSTAGSSGLGLAIVKKIVEAHGWTINIQSSSKQTCFQIFIPIKDVVKQE
ncbi:MAG: sensor histidine kinase, partial [Candidatus Odinarchaeota archaeon]